jgi:hypothetical protein
VTISNASTFRGIGGEGSDDEEVNTMVEYDCENDYSHIYKSLEERTPSSIDDTD